ncbi:urea ABC transporter permease subunit UrtB [Pelagibacterium sp. 26DY04]|uniref:urea ABC transporter permease subunit UrtB n=1 Tax=Pelagibacterium sp. 26DY04 TaxID=2967130 RepID=UPI002814C40C|nr:urea ABC transporter permease subunit UrtB [Pelagibacterium sp. 26DY04]WMT87209.1 urea ABC transporter permease subunit UrtB [Pelagibacterium sp. 26DY04]
MRCLDRLRNLGAALLVAALVSLGATGAKAQSVAETVPTMYDASLGDLRDAVAALVSSGEDEALPILRALGDGQLYEAENGGIYIQTGRNQYHDALTGTEADTEVTGELDVIRINNSLRRDIAAAIGTMTLMSENPATRRAAASQMLSSPEEANLELLETAIAAEENAGVRTLMEEARAASLLETELEDAQFEEAVATIAARGDRTALSILNGARGGASEIQLAQLETGIAQINQTLALWSVGQNVWYGISLGSVLLLAAIGLAITFGVMGVINMAHGEMVMIGAYVTFIVQEIIRTTNPALFDYSLAIAIPLAFLVTGLIGIAIERGIIRWLYGRPLETLLATWGLSLIIQQGVRTIFGATNREVGNPSWMSGAFELGGLAITWNRLWILVFAFLVFALLLLVLNRTPLGLEMRAVTQNRRMASSMGIRTPWVDAMTFGLGSGVAGLAGVALSQIDNVSPNLGQNYIIDSFMVVVFGGVGNLWGTLVGALSIGVVNKFLEPYAGAVLAKILILALIILFIQRKPRGLFALKGRAVEA